MRLTNDESKQECGLATRKAVEEFIFIAEISTEWIKDYLDLGQRKEDVNSYLSEKVKWGFEEYYQSHRMTFYKEEGTFFNGEIQVDLETVSRLYDKFFYDEDGDRETQYKNYLRKEFGTDALYEIEFLKLVNKSYFTQLLQDEKFLNTLLAPVDGKLKYLNDKELYIERLTTNVIDKLDNMRVPISERAIKIDSEIKFWRELILDKSRELLSEIMKVDKEKHYHYIRVLILKSLIEATGIGAHNQTQMQYFIGNVLGLDYEDVKGCYKTLKAKTKEDKRFKKQLEEALKTCDLLKSKEDSEGNFFVEKVKELISPTDTLEQKDEK